jgi:hypothetical protein
LLHIADYTEYVASHPGDSDAATFAKLTGVRTTLEVPMLKNNDVVGAMVIYRTEVRNFDDREMALVKDFAAQAVIAIENARLLNELRQRTTDLTEALDQQTATSDVLQVISSSPGDLVPVFATMLENATRVCDADFGVLTLYEGEDRFRVVAMHNAPPAYAELRQREPVISPGPFVRMVMTKQPFQISDMAEHPAYKERSDPNLVSFLPGCNQSPRPDAERRRVDWHYHRLSHGGAFVRQQADGPSQELRRAGGHRHRERAVAQRIAAVAGAADRDC